MEQQTDLQGTQIVIEGQQTEVKGEQVPEVKTDETVQTKQEVKIDSLETKKEVMIPKERFDEVNGKYKSLSDELEALKAEKEAKELELESTKKETEGKTSTLQTQTTELQSKVEKYEAMIEGMVSAKVESVPEEMKDLIPEGLSNEQKLSWLTKAEEKGLFKKAGGVVIGQPLNHSANADKDEAVKHMNPLQLFASVYGKR